MIAFLQLIRFVNLLIIALALSLFYYLIIVPLHINQLFTTLVPLSDVEFGLFVLSVMLIAASGNIINDINDYALDKEYKPWRPLPSAKFTIDQATYLHVLLTVSGILLGFYLGWKNNMFKVGFIYIIASLLLYIYSSYLKKVPLAGNVLVAALSAFVFVLLMLFEINFLRTIQFENATFTYQVLLFQLKFYALFAFAVSLAREIVKTLEDYEGDAAFGINTIAVQFGPMVARITAMVVLLGIVAGLLWFSSMLVESKAYRQVAYVQVAIVVPVVACIFLLFKANSVKQYNRISLLIKLVMLTGILTIPVFYWMARM